VVHFGQDKPIFRVKSWKLISLENKLLLNSSGRDVLVHIAGIGSCYFLWAKKLSLFYGNPMATDGIN
jgi:hypothetical protein